MKEDQVVDVCLPFLLCLHSVCEQTGDVSCPCEQGAQRYENIYVDRQVGKSIKMLGTMKIYWSHSIHKYRQIHLLNYDCYQDVKRLSTSITKKI